MRQFGPIDNWFDFTLLILLIVAFLATGIAGVTTNPLHQTMIVTILNFLVEIGLILYVAFNIYDPPSKH